MSDQQLESEAFSTVSIKERGWQKAVEDIYPLKKNAFIDQDPKRPLMLSHLNLQGTNIRNVSLPDKVYPSVTSAMTAFADGSPAPPHSLCKLCLSHGLFRYREEDLMLWTICMLMIVLWLVGIVVFEL